LKVLSRRALPALLRLIGAEADPAKVRFENVAINLPEYNADDVLVLGDADAPIPGALLVEYQLQPDPELPESWHYKATALARTLGIPVVLVVIYLERGAYATFPDSYEVSVGGLPNRFSFPAIRLWEHEERITSGDLQTLAPLLLLCTKEKTEAVLQRERRLILDLPISPDTRRDLLAVATMVGRRFFDVAVLRRIFREEMAMLKEADFIQEWIDEGEANGEARGARKMLLHMLRRQFGSLTPDLEARLAELTPEQCMDLYDRAADAKDLSELGF
jgi:predicted transposase YdaD